MYLKTFLFLHEFWILWEFRILGYFYLKPFNYVFLLFSSLHNFRCKAYCHSLLVSLCPVSPPPPWKTIVLPFELFHCDRLWICSEQPPPPLVPSSTAALTEVRKETASVPARLLHIHISCQSFLIYDWDLQCWTRAHESLVVTAVDSTSSQGIVKFYCLVHLGQFPRFPFKLDLVRCSTSRFVLFFLCNVVLAWRISSSFSWTNVFWKSWNL